MVKRYSHCQYANFYTFQHGPDFCCSAYFLYHLLFFYYSFNFSATKILKLVFPIFCQRKTNKKQTLMVHKVSPGDIFANNYGCEHMKNQLTTPTQDKIQSCLEISVLTMKVTFHNELFGFSKVIELVLSQIMDQKGLNPMS